MSLTLRRILYITFIGAFLLITPLVILYANGYSLSLDKRILVKTGALIIDTVPRGAKIYLNNQPQEDLLNKYLSREKKYVATPAKIKNLLPGEYEVKIELDGYWPWRKKLTVSPGESTYAEDIILFKKNLPLPLVSGGIKKIALSPDKNFLAGGGDKSLFIVNLIGEETTSLPLNDGGKEPTLAWAPSSKKILVNKTVFNLANTAEATDLNKLLKGEAVKLRWDNSSDDKIYYQSKNNLYRLTLSTKTNQPILSNQKESSGDYLVKNDNLFLIKSSNKLTSLNVFAIDSGKEIVAIDLPNSEDYLFVNPEHELINLYDNKHQILYLLDPFSAFYPPLREIINNIKFAVWVNPNKMLYANDFEIWLYGLADGKKTLLTRISRPISGITWHPSNNYVIYSTGETLNTIELDEREKRIITELIKLDKIDYPFINQNGKTLYFYASIGNQQGLYKLAIQ